MKKLLEQKRSAFTATCQPEGDERQPDKEERQLQADVLKEYLQKLDTAMKDSELMMIRLHPFVILPIAGNLNISGICRRNT